MVNHLTMSCNAASTFTWIHTTLIEARFTQLTIGANHTLWTATNQWITIVILATDTGQYTILFTAFSVCAALNGIARSTATAFNWSDW